MAVPSAFVEVWLLARRHGYTLERFLDLVETTTGIVASGATPQEQYLTYCQKGLADDTVLALEGAIVRDEQGTADNPVALDRKSTTKSLARESSAVTGGDSGKVKQRHLGRWVVLLVVVVLAGLVLTMAGGSVYKDGLAHDMLMLSPLAFLAVLLLLGVVIRTRYRIFQRLYIPSSLIGGLLGLAFFQIHRAVFEAAGYHTGSAAVDHLHDTWLPIVVVGLNVIFAGLFIGQNIPSLSRMWEICCAQFVYGQILAWGQYAVGMSIGTLFGYHLGPPHQELFGAVLPVGFEGGHGVGESMRTTFQKKGWPDGPEYCEVSSTFGFFGGITLGVALINWYRRFKCRAKPPPQIDLLKALVDKDGEEDSGSGVAPDAEEEFVDPFEKLREQEAENKRMRKELRATFVAEDRQKSAGRTIVQTVSVGLLSYHLSFLFAAIAFGYGVKSILVLFDNVVPGAVFASVPAFPFSMIGGIVLQKVLHHAGHEDKLDTTIMKHLSDFALDFIVVGATAGIRIHRISEGLLAFLGLMVAGLMFQVLMVVFVAERFFVSHWFERGIVEFGQSTGVTATGLLLLKLVDNDASTGVLTAFAFKQLLHEPIMGGGIWTSAAIPVVGAIGPWPMFGITAAIIIAYIVLHKYYVDPKQRQQVISEAEARVGD
eukprot:TRINITY_DN13640_c0_g1_i2.p1 TRINITY_DN13640_c0_g1~~TRINITY_DN13640_c0_g1_i2.p1  ORF type:complete len:655 (+),score=125.47 TRINITY_DN13640_c0_g1_i2:74-2038(+)